MVKDLILSVAGSRYKLTLNRDSKGNKYYVLDGTNIKNYLSVGEDEIGFKVLDRLVIVGKRKAIENVVSESSFENPINVFDGEPISTDNYLVLTRHSKITINLDAVMLEPNILGRNIFKVLQPSNIKDTKFVTWTVVAINLNELSPYSYDSSAIINAFKDLKV